MSGGSAKRKSDSLKQDEETGASQNACDNCKAKKYKCSKEQPACFLCLRHSKPCRYSDRIIRTPLTRVHLTQVENRLQAIEAVFARLLPDINIDDAISSLPSSQLQTQNDTSKLHESATATATIKTNLVADDASPEALPQEADGFDWKEEELEANGLSDGMAALSVETSGIGYLGSTSSISFLRSLRPWITGQQIFVPSSSTSFQSPQTLEGSLSPSTHLSEQALSHQVSARLIDGYFSNYHTIYPFTHEATFRAQYSEQVKRPEKHAWDMLLYSVLALGAWTIETVDNDLHDVFYQKAISSWQKRFILESGSIPLVQALLLLSNYTQKRNKMNTGWNFLGLAVRVATGLGLHKELPKWNVSLLQREIRRRVWWSLVILDSGASMTFGRPVLLPNDDTMDIKQVLNIHDELLTPLTVKAPTEVDEPTLYSSLIASATFHLAANTILKRLLSSTAISAKDTLALNALLTRWSTALPGFFQLDQDPAASFDWYLFARSRLWWKFWNMQITLTRPFLHRWVLRSFRPCQDFDSDQEELNCKAICIDSAHETITSVAYYIQQNSLPKAMSWYALYFMFHAALITAVCLRADPSSYDAPAWANDLSITKSALITQFATNRLAARCLDILNAFNTEPLLDAAGNILPPLQIDDAMLDFSFWSSTAADSVNLLDWPVFGDEFS